MDINMIKFYINILKKDDINKFLKNNSILLNNNEFDYIYNIFKNKYELVLKEDKDIFNDIKNNISFDNYNKLYDLYLKYKKRFRKI